LAECKGIPQAKDFYAIARHIEENKIQGLLVIGGWSGYEAAYKLFSQRDTFPAFNIPIVCLPASIDNNLPGSELSIGADTALNNIIEAVDKIKQSAVASNRCFVVQVMGGYCGYLALMSGLATGAEQVYLHEDGLSLSHLQKDLGRLMDGFNQGKRVGLVIFNEDAHQVYTSNFISSMFAEEGKAVFQVRQAILGHLQQGGDPSPFDRIQGTRFAAKCLDFLIKEASNPIPGAGFIGLQGGQTNFFDLAELPRLMDMNLGRPKQQWWMSLRDLANILSMSAP
jgi:6-phosphofructokinase 1